MPRDRSIVTLPALVKEVNAAFGNKDGHKRIREEYQAQRQVQQCGYYMNSSSVPNVTSSFDELCKASLETDKGSHASTTVKELPQLKNTLPNTRR